jgi:hypothetical protein
MNTNDLQLAQQVVATTGHHLTTLELTFLMSLPTSIAAHFWAGVKFWSMVGGWRGVWRFIQTGSIRPLDSAPSVNAINPPGLPAQPTKT